MMKSGTYYIGDLCYVLGGEVWDEVCYLHYAHGCGQLTLKDGREIAIYSTKFGDGEFDGVMVDSGTIGCILLDDIAELTSHRGIKVVKFDRDFYTSEKSGLISFGHISINTDDSHEYDDYDSSEE